MEATEKPSRLLRLPQVTNLTGLGRTAIYAAIQRGDFPRQVRLTERTSAWREADILGWINSRPTVNVCDK